MPLAQQPKSISHVVNETTTFGVGMLSVRTSIRCSCNRLRDQTLAGLLLPCCPGLTENAGTDGLRQSKPSNFLTPVVMQELSPHLFALCPLQDPREAHLHPYRAHCRPASSSGASWVPTGEVHSRPNCSTYSTHRGPI